MYTYRENIVNDWTKVVCEIFYWRFMSEPVKVDSSEIKILLEINKD